MCIRVPVNGFVQFHISYVHIQLCFVKMHFTLRIQSVARSCSLVTEVKTSEMTLTTWHRTKPLDPDTEKHRVWS